MRAFRPWLRGCAPGLIERYSPLPMVGEMLSEVARLAHFTRVARN
jgi:hypothetical protein